MVRLVYLLSDHGITEMGSPAQIINYLAFESRIEPSRIASVLSDCFPGKTISIPMRFPAGGVVVGTDFKPTVLDEPFTRDVAEYFCVNSDFANHIIREFEESTREES